MMLILKIPIVYLGLVDWNAIRAEPELGVDPDRVLDLAAVALADRSATAAGGPHGSRDSARTEHARRGRVAS